MKKVIYLTATLVLVLSLTIGCTSDKTDPDDSNKGVIVDEDQEAADKSDKDDDVEDERTAEDIMDEFGDKIEISLIDAGNFIDKNIDKLSETEVDEMVSELIKRTEENIEKVRSRISDIDKDQEVMDSFKDDLYLSQDQIDKMNDDELKEELKKLQDENYRLINIEGQYDPVVNYEGFKKYDDHVSDEVRDYINLKARDTNKPVALDGELYISYEELADRIIETENYIKKYGEGDRYAEALNMYRNKLNIYMLGLPNTPMTEDSSDKIKQELMDSYEQTALIQDSSSGFIVGKYIKAIKENKNLIDDEIKSKGELLLEEATELIGRGK